MDQEVTFAELAAREGLQWSPDAPDSSPRHVLDEPEPQRGALINYWFSPPEPRAEHVDDVPPVSHTCTSTKEGNTAVSATPQEQQPKPVEKQTGSPIDAETWAAGRIERAERWLTAGPPQ